MVGREVRVLTWVRGSDDDVRAGLLGWIAVQYGDLIVDGIALRKTANDNRLCLAFPKRAAKNGVLHSIVRPIDDSARRAIEREILGQLGQRPEARIAEGESR